MLARAGDGRLPDRCANASNWPRLPPPRGPDNRILSRVRACLNAFDPCREAKLRRAAARSDPAAGPSSLPGAPVSQPCAARSCGSARDLPVREPARLGPAVELVPGLARLLERGASSVAAQAGGANPGDARAGDRWRAHPGAARLRRELGVRPRHDAGTGLDAPPTRAAARLQRAHAVERPRTVGTSAPRASNVGAADGRVHRGGLAGGGAAAGAWGLAVARGGGAAERGSGRPRRSGGRAARPRARWAGAGSGRRAGSWRTRTSTS